VLAHVVPPLQHVKDFGNPPSPVASDYPPSPDLEALSPKDDDQVDPFIVYARLQRLNPRSSTQSTPDRESKPSERLCLMTLKVVPILSLNTPSSLVKPRTKRLGKRYVDGPL
jgi:hypothetical protein